MKKFVSMFLVIALLVSSGIVLAAEDVVDSAGSVNFEEFSGPQRADVLHYYTVKNKIFLGVEESIVRYISSAWSKADRYIVAESITSTMSLSAIPLSGIFNTSNVLAAGQFAASVSQTFGLNTHIPADASKLSKLVVKGRSNKYKGDSYYVANYGYTTSETYKGTGYVYEPTGLYMIPIYEGEPWF